MCGRKMDFSCFVIWFIAIILGIILGIIAFNILIPGIIIVLFISLGIGFLGAILTTILGLVQKAKKCICEKGKCLVMSSIGTVIFTIISLAITIVTASVPVAILLGITIAFLVATILNILKILLCLADENCKKYNDM